MKNKQLILNKKINLRKYSLIKYLLTEFLNIYLANLIIIFTLLSSFYKVNKSKYNNLFYFYLILSKESNLLSDLSWQATYWCSPSLVWALIM